MPTRIQLRRGTTAEWGLVDPVLDPGELGVELMGAGVASKAKIGDGVTAWSSLDYLVDDAGAVTEQVQDVIGAMATDSATVNFTYDDVAGTLTATVIGLTSGSLSDFAEAVRDRLGATLVGGPGISVTVDDPGDTVTITAEVTQAELDAHAGAADPHAGYQKESEKGVAGGYASLDGGGTVPDAQIPATITRDAELSAAVTAAIDALIAGAPGALDTLNELAAAIGDDSNFAATVTTALALKANDAAVVHTAGAETVTGVKTFDADAILAAARNLRLGGVSSVGGGAGLLAAGDASTPPGSNPSAGVGLLYLEGGSWKVRTATGTPGAGGKAIVLDNDARLVDSRAPNGAAGGVLSGTYPNPGFAVDMATQAELDAEAAARAAADALKADLPTVLRKTVDGTAVNNSTVLVNDSVLFAALPANVVRRFRAVLWVSGPTGGDMDLAFAVPAGSTLIWSRMSERTTDTSASTGGIAVDTASASGGRLPVGTFGAGVKSMVIVNGVVRTAGTAGTLQLQRSQTVAVVGDTIIHADSWLEVIADP